MTAQPLIIAPHQYCEKGGQRAEDVTEYLWSPAARAAQKFGRRAVGRVSSCFFVAGLLISACMTGCAASRRVTLDDVRARYPAFRAQEPLDLQSIRLLALGLIKDPATTAGRLIPEIPGNGPDTRFFTRLRLQRVDVYLRPSAPVTMSTFYGPKAGEPEGIYAFEVHPSGSAGCESFEQAMRARRSTPGLSDAVAPIGKCLTWRYVGPLVFDQDTVIALSYFDSQAETRGYGVHVNELRHGPNEVISRSIDCFSSLNLPRFLEGCGPPLKPLDLLL